MRAIIDFKQQSLYLRIIQYFNFWQKLCERYKNYAVGQVQLKCIVQLTDIDVGRFNNCRHWKD